MREPKLLRCTETALENERNALPEGFPDREEAKAAMQHAITECDRKKLQANQRVRELLKEKGIVACEPRS